MMLLLVDELCLPRPFLPYRCAILLLPTLKQENIVFGLSASGASFPRGAVPDDAMADAGRRVPLVRWRPRLGVCCMVLYSCMLIQRCMALYGAVWLYGAGGKA